MIDLLLMEFFNKLISTARFGPFADNQEAKKSFESIRDNMWLTFGIETAEQQSLRHAQLRFASYSQRVNAASKLPAEKAIPELNRILDDIDADPANPLAALLHKIPDITLEESKAQNETIIKREQFEKLLDEPYKTCMSKKEDMYAAQQSLHLWNLRNPNEPYTNDKQTEKRRLDKAYKDATAEFTKSERTYNISKNLFDKSYADAYREASDAFHAPEVRKQRILRAESLETLNQELTAQATDLPEQITDLNQYKPWFKLNQEINKQKKFFHTLYRHKIDIEQAETINDLNKIFRAHDEFEKQLVDLPLAEKQKHRAVIFAAYINKINTFYRRDVEQNDKHMLIKGQLLNNHSMIIYEGLMALNSNEAGYNEIIALNTVFNEDGTFNHIELYNKLSGLDLGSLSLLQLSHVFKLSLCLPRENKDHSLQDKISTQLKDQKFAKNEHAKLLNFKTDLSVLDISTDSRAIKELSKEISHRLELFQFSRGNPNKDEMKEIILAAVIAAVSKRNLTKEDIAALFNLLKPSNDPSRSEIQKELHAIIHTKTKNLGLYSHKVTTGTWDKILELLKNHAALLKVEQKIQETNTKDTPVITVNGKTIEQSRPADAQVEESTQGESDTNQAIDALIDSKRNQWFSSKQESAPVSQISKASHTSSASAGSSNSQASTSSTSTLYSWFSKPKSTATREMLSMLDDKETIAAAKKHFENDISKITAAVR